MRVLAVFNTCGISGRDNTAFYIENINSLLSQDYKDMDIVISDCCSPEPVRQRLIAEFGERGVKFIFVDSVVPVNVTFNLAARVFTEQYGEYEGYLYIDSGIRFTDNNSISRLAARLDNPNSAMIASRTNTDSGIFLWFGLGNGFGDESAQDQLFANGDLIIPVGKALNLHVQIFTKDIYKAYNRKLMPDIFASYCTESTFSFVTAGIGKDWIMTHDVIAEHRHGMDGGSSGFKPEALTYPPWQHTFGTSRTMFDIIGNPEAAECGFGYEECQSILLHNHAVYDENGKHENPEALKKFVANNIYLHDDEFDYNAIQYKVV